jgi:phage shock protein PspC (stress-responsive transcriptional regulator)
MKKTLSISIAHRIFNLEDDAYQKLEQYLSSIKSHFNDNPDKIEVVSDIEERIAEHFLESKTGIITLEDVESLIKTMGTVDQFEQSVERDNAKSNSKRKQLYRDTEDAVIAGVASGISHYFNIDPIITRIIFIASIFAGGTGFLVYIILWLVVPEAKTASQKLTMYGNPITLETLSEAARDRLNEIKTRDKSSLRKLVMLPFRIIGTVVRFLANFILIIFRGFFGIILVTVGIAVLIAIMIASGFMVSEDIMIFEGVSFQAFIPGLLRYLIIFGVALVMMIPALFALLGGISLFKKKNMITSYVGLGLLGVWLIALSISGYGVAKVANRYEALVNTLPAYEEATNTVAIEETFDNLVIQNGLNVNIVEGITPSMTVTGRDVDINSIQAVIVDNILTIERERVKTERFCLFCFIHNNSTEITLTITETLGSISVVHGSSATGKFATSTTLDINIENGSYAKFVIEVQDLTAKVNHGSHLILSGRSESADFTLKNGVLEGEEFIMTDTKIDALHGSRANINVVRTLDATAKTGSAIYYAGNPEVTKNETSGSSIRSEN